VARLHDAINAAQLAAFASHKLASFNADEVSWRIRAERCPAWTSRFFAPDPGYTPKVGSSASPSGEL